MLRSLNLRIHGAALLAGAAVLAGAATAGCLRTSTAVPKPGNPAPFFALRFAFNDSAEGRERVQSGDTTVFLASEVLVSDEDLLSVSTIERPGERLLLDVRLRPESAQKLATATAGHVGDHLAVLLDSRVWNLAPMASPIGGAGSLTIATKAMGEDAERIAVQIRSRWPAR